MVSPLDTLMTQESPDDYFSSRPPKTSVQCPCCGGSGARLSPYWLAPCGVALRGSPKGAVCARVVGSATIFEVTKEASEVSVRSGRPVSFVFISDVLTVYPESDPVQLACEWWIARYGETPEETAVKR